MEKNLELKFRKAVKAKGGIAIKWTAPGFTGVPDRIVLFPNGRIFFAEIKDGNKPLSPRQVIVIDMLKRLGFQVWVVRTEADIENNLK